MLTYRCPTCGKTVRVQAKEDAPNRPFCSRRCRMIDLHKWFEGEYRISEPLEIPVNAEEEQVRDRLD